MVDRRTLLLGMAVSPAAMAQPNPPAANAFGFTFQSLEGAAMPLSRFRGRVLLVANTASFCGFTPQYAALQRVHDRYEAQGLTVIGVPSNDFNQESTDAEKIREFCDGMFGITFPMTALNHVKGQEAHPFFAWAAREAGPVGWNFHKYLVSRNGAQVQGFSTRTDPEAPEVTSAIEAALAARG
ncbi:glutathione peroxidase [Roseococcus sp. YIM B11640]|uniref:glutathione peroxidase n=1 Tax=Roseococcus sp. YIM B11640 TaxID=3133973 RepID=UPI003C7E72CE